MGVRLIHPAEGDRVTVNQVTVSHECWRVSDMVRKSDGGCHVWWRIPAENFVFARIHSSWCLESFTCEPKGKGWWKGQVCPWVCSAAKSHVWPNNRLTAHQRLFPTTKLCLKVNSKLCGWRRMFEKKTLKDASFFPPLALSLLVVVSLLCYQNVLAVVWRHGGGKVFLKTPLVGLNLTGTKTRTTRWRFYNPSFSL